jgi:hypothetical protein
MLVNQPVLQWRIIVPLNHLLGFLSVAQTTAFAKLPWRIAYCV